MVEPTKIYYRPLVVFGELVVTVLMVWFSWNAERFPSSRFPMTNEPPGLWLVYAIGAGLAALAVWRLPRLWLTILRKPAVEFDGETLTLRNFTTRRFKVSTADIRYAIPRDDGPIIILADGDEVGRFPPSRIDGSLTLTRLLDRLGRAAPEGS